MPSQLRNWYLCYRSKTGFYATVSVILGQVLNTVGVAHRGNSLGLDVKLGYIYIYIYRSHLYLM